MKAAFLGGSFFFLFEGFCSALLQDLGFLGSNLFSLSSKSFTIAVLISFLQILTNCGAVFKYYIHVSVSVLNPEVKHSRLSFHYLSRWHYMAKC